MLSLFVLIATAAVAQPTLPAPPVMDVPQVSEIATVPLFPDPKLTSGTTDPNVTQATIAKTICIPGYSSGVRNVSSATKKAVFKEYGIDPKSQHFEIDHDISLENGGTNAIENLWPQSYDTKPFNAHTKDKLEDHVHTLICHGEISLEEGQADLSGDWRPAYVRYFGNP
jgi:hypothetical protein